MTGELPDGAVTRHGHPQGDLEPVTPTFGECRAVRRVLCVGMWAGVSVSGQGGAATAAGVAAFAEERAAPLPAALAELYLSVGVGTFGGFLHFEPPHGMSTHRETIEHLIDDDDEEDLAPTADVIVFARSDNGDMCGWHLPDLAAGQDRVVRLQGFDEEPLADSTRQFLDNLPHTDYFGVGVLPATYQRHGWLTASDAPPRS